MNATRDKLSMELLKGVKIPPQPAILAKIHEELQRDDPDHERISKIIGYDVALSAAVLKTVNSAYFGLKSEVQSVRHALSLLEIKTTVNIVAGFALRQSFENSNLPQLPRFWDAATNTARLCAFLATRVSRLPADPAYTLGLFRDCGIPLMAQRFDNYLQVLQQANSEDNPVFTDTEERHYETNHAVIGFYVSRAWSLPSTIREVILNHHNLELMIGHQAPSDDVSGLHTATLKLAEWGDNHFRGVEQDLEWERYGDLVLDYLRLSESDAYDLLEEMKDLLLEAAY